MKLKAVRCRCGTVVLDGTFRGIVRVRCPSKKCRRRVWVAGDGQELRLVQLDKAPRSVA